MADLTATQLAWLRDKIGDEPADDVLQGYYDSTGSVRDTAITVLGQRRRALLDSSLKVSVSGVASIDNTENVKAIERDIAALAKLDDDPTDEEGEDTGGLGDNSTEVFQLTRTRGR